MPDSNCPKCDCSEGMMLQLKPWTLEDNAPDVTYYRIQCKNCSNKYSIWVVDGITNYERPEEILRESEAFIKFRGLPTERKAPRCEQSSPVRRFEYYDSSNKMIYFCVSDVRPAMDNRKWHTLLIRDYETNTVIKKILRKKEMKVANNIIGVTGDRLREWQKKSDAVLRE